jgi:hypothetical protein
MDHDRFHRVVLAVAGVAIALCAVAFIINTINFIIRIR